MSINLEAALLYLSRGWSIIPIDVTGPIKKPYVDWKPYQTRRATEQELKTWWSVWPHAAVGIVTGKISDVVVIDIDPRHGGQPEPILEAAPTNLRVQTGGGGWHYYYSYPDNVERVPNRVGIIQGIDIRADGGYAVLPPSNHSSGGVYSFDLDGVPGTLPESMLDSIISSETQNRVGKGDEPFWFSKLWNEGAPEGLRNDSVARLAGYLAKKDLPKDIVMTMLEEWNVSANSDPLPNREILTTVNSVFSTKTRKTNSRDKHKGDDVPPKLFDLININDYITKFGDTEMQWTVKNWLPQDTIGFMVAAPESYKTWLLLDLAVSVATGLPFLGMYEIENPGPVIVVQQEDYHGSMAERCAVIIQGKNQTSLNLENQELLLPPSIPVYLHPNRELKFNDVAVMDKLEEHIARIRPKLVLIDPLYSAASMEDYMSKAVDDMFRMKGWRDKYGCSFVLAHHTKKLGNDKTITTGREDLWGSQFLNAFLETGWQIRTADNYGNILVRRHFKASQGSEEIYLKFDINTEVYPFYYRVSEGEKPTASKADEIVDLLRFENKALTLAEIAVKLGKHNSTISRQVKGLIADDVLYKGEDGKIYITMRPEDANFAR